MGVTLCFMQQEAHHKNDSIDSVMTEREREKKEDILCASGGVGVNFDSV